MKWTKVITLSLIYMQYKLHDNFMSEINQLTIILLRENACHIYDPLV